MVNYLKGLEKVLPRAAPIIAEYQENLRRKLELFTREVLSTLIHDTPHQLTVLNQIQERLKNEHISLDGLKSVLDLMMNLNSAKQDGDMHKALHLLSYMCGSL